MATKKMERIVATETAINSEKTTKANVEKLKTWNPEDLIPCRSVVNGQLFVKGDRSGYEYNWADYGDVIDIEYRDLNYMARMSGNVTVYSPRIIIEDEDFVNQNPKIKQLYESMYTINDFREILNLNASQMRKAIDELPSGAKESIKGLAATMIEEGRLDSVQKIKAIDDIFGTQLLLTLAQN